MNNTRIFAGMKDYAFLLILFLLSLIAWHLHVAQNVPSSAEYEIVIFTEQPVTKVFKKPLSMPLNIQGKIGPAKVEWNKKGEVRIASSACPCKTCVNYGWIKSGSVVCVPNGIVVRIVKGGEEADAISR
ncbi:MAG: hypothetical protein Kow0029_19000 [Candidatus Rifleibacteriota bacterium]